jgi:hypothetical protein
MNNFCSDCNMKIDNNNNVVCSNCNVNLCFNCMSGNLLGNQYCNKCQTINELKIKK